LKPDYAEAYNNLGWAYNNVGNFQLALQPLKKAIELNPALPEAHLNIGITYTRSLDPRTANQPAAIAQKQQALAEFQKTVELRPDWPAAQNNLGVAYGSLGKWKEAIEAHKEAIRLKPDYQGALYNLGVDYLISGDKKKAIEQYEKLKPISLNNANALYIQIYRKAPPKNTKPSSH
jgi:protein O-GlcNAc transferase